MKHVVICSLFIAAGWLFGVLGWMLLGLAVGLFLFFFVLLHAD